MARTQRFLVKMAPYTGKATMNLRNSHVSFDVEPLMPSIDGPRGLGAAPAHIWHVVQPSFAIDSANPWDVCHSIVQHGLGLAGGQPVFAEPDFAQRWTTQPPEDAKMALAEACVPTAQKTGEDGYPGNANPLWHRDSQHAQFEQFGNLDVPPAEAVRVAHLDTGYDPEHASTPARLETQLQRNFVDKDRPEDARDDSSGLFNNLGHGTGTLSILAGAPAGGLPSLGAAPFVKVAPLRVADRVVLFHNSAIAKALDHVHRLCANPQTAVDVVTMSMGGLASRAWADAVNALYDEGVLVVTAAGNNFGNLPTRNIVFPARFNRVIAACGVMADQTPYADLPVSKMAGNYGPTSKMRTAMAAYTPNVPWAKFGCGAVVDLDGAGTSAATPQIAASAALYIQKNKAALAAFPHRWMRVEAVRRALFSTASPGSHQEKLGRGALRAADAYNAPVADPLDLTPEEPDSASFSFLRVLTGFGAADLSSAEREMLELEALQLSQSNDIEQLLPDPNGDLSRLTLAQVTSIAAALAAHPLASSTLKRALAVVPSLPPAGTVPTWAEPLSSIERLHLEHALAPKAPPPAWRRLRIYAYDPSLGQQLETVALNETVAQVRWEQGLQPGPAGEYIEVVDIDFASGCCYAPVDLNSPALLANDGLRPSEANPQFHQQMVYAVAMNTIEHFERALGRVALWSPRFETPIDPAAHAKGDRQRSAERYVQRLRIYPHALREENAYYSPERKALLLGYFCAAGTESGVPSEAVFAALSHDIVAHETSHALLDGIHRRFREPTNPDVLAFHEGFADIVALFQHFTLSDSLREQIARSRGDLTQETLLGKLAVQFGRATGRRGALREFIGRMVKKGSSEVWRPHKPSVRDYASAKEAHERGAVLVAAVFDAFLKIYAKRSLIPIRLETNGSEVLPRGAISRDLADALAELASKVARHVLQMCVRALDYCPPVDITFGDFLRALVTADRDLVPNDPLGYRVAFVSAFRARGIHAENVRTVSVDTLTWEPPPIPFANLGMLLPKLKLQWDLQTNRRQAWETSRDNASAFRGWLVDPRCVSDDELASLGVRREPDVQFRLGAVDGSSVPVELRGIEVHAVRPVRRVGPDAQLLSQVVVEVTQSMHSIDAFGPVYRGGATLIIDLNRQAVSYLVRKRIDQSARVSRQQAMWSARPGQPQQWENNFTALTDKWAEPFALLHCRY